MMTKWALVTGASQGLGLCLCKELLNRGYSVLALDLRISDELKALEGENLQIAECDISNDDAVRAAGEKFKGESLEIIFNNAGVWLDKDRRLLSDAEFSFENMTTQYQINAVGVLRIAREFMPKLLLGKNKVMVNMSSEAGSIGACRRKCEYGYCMSKAAQNMATKILTNDYSREGVKIYAVHPGWMMTPQGFAGAKGDMQPQQNPMDTARVFVDLAEGERRDGIYYDVDGNSFDW